MELHELWLKREHRGKGYGKKFFEFFEEFVASMGYSHMIYYAYDPTAIAICRRRGYEEAYGVEAAGRICWVFCLSLKNQNERIG